MNEPEHESSEASDELPPPRRQPRPPVIIGVIVLIVVIIGGGFFAVRSFGGGLLTSSATPTPTLPPGANLFYITTNPAWGTVSIDGHPVTHLPALGQTPIQVAPGNHTITWNAPPFPVQRCFLDVPPQQTSGAGLCDTSTSANITTGADAGQQAFIIPFAATGGNLSNTARASLVQAVKTYLTTFQTSASVQPGDFYASVQTAHQLATATQPLLATPHFQLDTNPNSTRPCLNSHGPGTPACHVGSINCQAFCPVSLSDANGKALPTTNWQVEAPVLITWSYAKPGGQVIATNQPDTPESSGYEDLVSFSITWNSATSTWNVINQPDSAPALFTLTTNPLCATAQNWIIANPSHQSLQGTTFNEQPTSVYFQYHAGTNAANGCLVKAIPALSSSAPVGYLLYRFGVLLAVNSAAHRYWPSLPMADAYGQGIARQLMKGI